MADDFPDFVKFEGFAGQAWYHQHMRDKRILRRAREFTPERLFKSGEQGVWYDPSDTTTLFQDSAGTTPVTASGQPVGLMLDKSKGLVRGPELVVNGGFDSDTTGWSSQTSTIRAVSGELEITSTGAGAATASFPITTVSGRMYEITGLARRGTSGDIAITAMDTQFGTTLVSNIVMITGQQSLRLVFTAADATTWVGCRIVNSSGAGLTAYFDNISVRELPGHHATQPTAASRPIYRRGDSRGVVNLLRWSKDFSNAAWQKSNTTVLPNHESSPYGLVSKHVVDNSSAYTTTVQVVVLRGATPYRISALVKAEGSNYITAGVIVNDFNYAAAQFDLAAGIVARVASTGGGAYKAYSAEITPQLDGYYLCSVTVEVPITLSVYTGAWVDSSVWVSGRPDRTQAGDGASGVLFAYSQLETGPTALPYQRNDANLGGVATGASTDLHWRNLDGVDDNMVSAAGGGGTTGFFLSQAVVVTGGTTRTLWSDAGTNTGYRVRINSANKLELSAGNGSAFTTVATTASLTLNKNHLITAWDDGANLNVQLDGGAIASVARPVVVAGTAGFTMGKNNTAASDYFAGFVYGDVYRRDTAPTTTERLAVQKYLANKAAVTL